MTTPLANKATQLLDVSLAQFPSDWPDQNSIDLTIHDLPHASSTIEWWYVNCHLTTEEGRDLSLFASFFRTLEQGDEQRGEPFHAHALTWAITDSGSHKYFTESLLDPQTPSIALRQIDIDIDTDSQTLPLKLAFKEIFEKEKVPLPDRLLENAATVNLQKLHLDYDGNQFIKLADGRYWLKLEHKSEDIGCELIFELEKPPARHGKNGIVRGTQGEGMFYYFVPQCRVTGTLTLEGQPLTVRKGQGWYDHEFGRPAERASDDRVAWNWVSAQLDNGYEVSAYHLIYCDTGQTCGHSAIVIDPQGGWREYSDFTLKPLEYWTSSRTFESYPIQWQLIIPEVGLRLKVEASSPAQEFVTLLSFPAFWEGRVTITGHMWGQEVEGLGFVERSGFISTETTTGFLESVNREAQKSLQDLLPLSPTSAQLERLVASASCPHYLDGLDPEQYVQSVLKPIRSITDRGGKAWRPYAFLACIDLVGGNSQAFLPWLGWPELLHVGSLIVDDVQDQSTVRRGGPACHELYGEPLAINAGNACYFLAEACLHSTTISDSHRLSLYQLYFEALRAAHAGQAIDLHGFSDLMPEIVQSGNGQLLERRVLSVYRLKSAVPASSLARAGALLGGGTPEQIEAFGAFFEALGIAFQIMDDVLNLRGFEDNLKNKGEDLSGGKITLPVVKAMSILPAEERKLLWQRIASRSTEPEILLKTILMLENAGAIEACVQQANQLLETGWKQLDPLVPDSQIKARLRGFSWFVLNRHF